MLKISLKPSWIGRAMSIINTNLYKNLKTSARSLVILILRPRNLLIYPILGLSNLHESDKRNPFAKKKPVLKDIITKADELYLENEEDELITFLLKHQNSEEPEILWRIARSLCDKGRHCEHDKLREGLLHKALLIIKIAVEKDSENYACHKWYAIILDLYGEFLGPNERLSHAMEIKHHFLKSIDLNDKDPTVLHLMGFWCFSFADFSWYQRKLSSFFFGAPPMSSFQEALDYFMRAEEVESGFNSMNYLMIAKTYIKMKNNEMAKKFLLKTMNCSIKNRDDKKAYAEAVELMKGYKLD